MKIYDITAAIRSAMPVYEGDPGVKIEPWSAFAKGDSSNVSMLNFGAHTGTHVDAPSHFLEGAAGVESLALDVLIGPAEVIEVPNGSHVIDEAFVANNCAGTLRVLFKTRNSAFWKESGTGFRADYTHLDPQAAAKLVELGARLVGIDYLSVEKFNSDNFETHHVLLSNGVIIVEGLDLGAVPAGKYELLCLPLRIRGGSGDGAPARAVLRTLD